MRLFPSLLIALALTGCKSDETISGYTDANAVWTLTEVNNTAFTARATITFPAEGKVSGKAPCNSYSSSQTVPLPWFKLGPILSTKMACADLAAEQIFFTNLGAASLAEVRGNILILSNETGLEMVFTTTP